MEWLRRTAMWERKSLQRKKSAFCLAIISGKMNLGVKIAATSTFFTGETCRWINFSLTNQLLMTSKALKCPEHAADCIIPVSSTRSGSERSFNRIWRSCHLCKNNTSIQLRVSHVNCCDVPAFVWVRYCTKSTSLAENVPLWVCKANVKCRCVTSASDLEDGDAVWQRRGWPRWRCAHWRRLVWSRRPADCSVFWPVIQRNNSMFLMKNLTILTTPSFHIVEPKH